MKNIRDYKAIHFIGIGGISMKTLAMLTHNLGVEVSGSDRVDSGAIAILRARGIDAYVGANTQKIEKCELVVYSSAIGMDDEELLFAHSKQIECLERKYFLAEVSKLCKKTVAIAGSHGKTTTTAMTCHILRLAEKKFIGHIGGDFYGKSFEDFCTGEDIFVTEACEYKQSFLCLSPSVSVVLNCDFDHPDSYENCQQLQQSFEDFLNNSSDFCVVGESCKEKFVIEKERKTLMFGYNFSCDYTAKNIVSDNGRYSYDLYKFGQFIGRIKLCVYGKFNILNSLAAVAICDVLQVPMAVILNGINCFFGVARRFECKGLSNSGARIIVDYAHHPEEIRQSIECAFNIVKEKLIVVFEPHTFSRTKALFDDFLTAFDKADNLIMLPTYSAREVEGQGVASIVLSKALEKRGIAAEYATSYGQAAELACNMSKNGDMILILGAGDIYKLAEIIMNE